MYCFQGYFLLIMWLFMFCGHIWTKHSTAQSCLKKIKRYSKLCEHLPRRLNRQLFNLLLVCCEVEQTNGAYRLFSEKNQIGKCTICSDNEYGNGPLAAHTIFVDLLQILNSKEKKNALIHLLTLSHVFNL